MFLRHTRSSDDLPMCLKKKRAYTFFSKFGLVQVLLLLILFLFAINYNNNMTLSGVVFLMVFLMVMLVRNNHSIKDISVVEASHSFGHEAEASQLIIRLRQKRVRKSYPLLHIRCNNCVCDVIFDQHGECVLTIPFRKENVGVYAFPHLMVYSYWPIGVSRTWIYSRPRSNVTVLPVDIQRPFQGPPLSSMSAPPTEASEGDVDGVREIGPGERGVKVAWKQSFRRNKMMTYTYEKSGHDTTIIEWPTDALLNVEQKIRVVSQNIINALQSETFFQVRHPQYMSRVGHTEKDAYEILQNLMLIVFPMQEWT